MSIVKSLCTDRQHKSRSARRNDAITLILHWFSFLLVSRVMQLSTKPKTIAYNFPHCAFSSKDKVLRKNLRFAIFILNSATNKYSNSCASWNCSLYKKHGYIWFSLSVATKLKRRSSPFSASLLSITKFVK